MRSTFRPLILCSSLLLACSVSAQQDSSTILLRPTFSLGSGAFAFYGDIGNQSEGYSPFVNRLAFEFRATTPINSWLEAGLFAQHGQLGANERGTLRNLNFKSRITTGGLQLTYNFNHLLRPEHVVEPYISLGFESVEFLSKTDLYDKDGRTYNYWSDGTIRDIAENAPNAADAVTIQRDYSYESDIRELDLDGFGKYTERSWAVPVGVGAKMKLGGGFDVRFGATMHFAFTDLMDGVSSASLNERTGDDRNDRFLYTGVSVSYALDLKKKERKQKDGPDLTPEQMDMLVLNDDEDADGVTDFKDDCPHTPLGAKVDEHGCPLDGDGDGVPDGVDEEPTTAKGAPVDAKGVTITDEKFLKDWLNYADSGNVNIVRSRVESLGGPKKENVFVQPKRIYTVRVGSEVEGITEEQMQQLLSIPDIRTVENGDTISFVVGGYDLLPEAIRRQLALKNSGVDGKVVAQEGDRLVDISDELAKAEAAMEGSTAGGNHADQGKTLVRVQLGAFKKKLSKNIFSSVPDLVTLKGDDGLTRYYTGVFTNINEAATHKVAMLGKGFGGAFLVAFKNGKRVSLKEAGAKLTRPESLKEKPVSGIDKADVRYRIQLGTFAGNVPSDVMGKFIEIGDVTNISGAEDTRYYHGSFKTRAEAAEALKNVQAKGITDAFVVGDLKGRIILADDADQLLAP